MPICTTINLNSTREHPLIIQLWSFITRKLCDLNIANLEFSTLINYQNMLLKYYINTWWSWNTTYILAFALFITRM